MVRRPRKGTPAPRSPHLHIHEPKMEKKTTKKQNRTLQSAVPRGRITELGRRAATAQLNDRRRRSSSPFSKSSRHRGHFVAINVSLRLPIGFGDDELSRTICISSRFGSMASTRSKSQRMKTKNTPSDKTTHRGDRNMQIGKEPAVVAVCKCMQISESRRATSLPPKSTTNQSSACMFLYANRGRYATSSNPIKERPPKRNETLIVIPILFF